jgi:hypothetical protein
MDTLLLYAAALFVASHGFTYVMYGLTAIYSGVLFEKWQGTSRLLGSTLTRENLKRIALALWLIAGAAFIVVGITIPFGVASLSWWKPLAVLASGAGILSFAVFWDGQTEQISTQGGIGMWISVLVLLATLVAPM